MHASARAVALTGCWPAARLRLQLWPLSLHPIKHNKFTDATTLAGVLRRKGHCQVREEGMQQRKWVLSTMLLGAMSLPAQTFGGARLVESAQPLASPSHYYLEIAAKKK